MQLLYTELRRVREKASKLDRQLEDADDAETAEEAMAICYLYEQLDELKRQAERLLELLRREPSECFRLWPWGSCRSSEG